MNFEYSSGTPAEMLEKTRAKCNHTTIYIASIENTRENTCKTRLAQQYCNFARVLAGVLWHVKTPISTNIRFPR